MGGILMKKMQQKFRGGVKWNNKTGKQINRMPDR